MRTLSLKTVRPYVRRDLGFHENEDEDQKCGDDRRSHHPGGKRLLVPEGTDEPASLLRGRDGKARRHIEFLKADKSNV